MNIYLIIYLRWKTYKLEKHKICNKGASIEGIFPYIGLIIDGGFGGENELGFFKKVKTKALAMVHYKSKVANYFRYGMEH